MASQLQLFVSHSSQDTVFAAALIELIRIALNLPADAIRCTSVDGCRLPSGANSHDQLRTETQEAVAFIGVISPHSIASTYVAFELGARWGAEMRFMVILTPGVGAEVLVPPLDVFNAMRGDSRDQLLQMIHDLGEQLDITLSPAHTYGTQIDRVLALQDDSAGQSSISETLSWSSFLSQLNMLSSESGRLDCISKYKTHLPSSTVLDLPLVYVQWS